MNSNLKDFLCVGAIILASAAAPIAMALSPEDAKASARSIKAESPEEVCVRGVVYYKWAAFAGASTPAVTPALMDSGKPYPCIPN